LRGDTVGPLDATDLVATLLDDFHPSAVQEEPGAWHVFFPTAGARDAAAIALMSLGDRVVVQAVDVPDEDWARRSQANLGPVVIGSLVVTPPWAARETTSPPSCAKRRPAGLEQTHIVILPSMGFGSGHHASTRLCLRLMQQIDFTGWSVADIGTGSGVLAIAARRLGAVSVLAVDDDEDALASARENLELNGLSEGPAGVEIRLGDFRSLPGLRANLVLANLTAALLIQGASLLLSALAPEGALVVSGLTLADEPAVIEAFRAGGDLVDRLTEDEWVGLLLRSRGSRWQVAGS
jgi:ribosomal protein L11 methyltransferase